MIKVTIYFANDPSVGIFAEAYTMEIPDFRAGWVSGEQTLKNYIKEKREIIEELYEELQGDFEPKVIFQWEQEEFEQLQDRSLNNLLEGLGDERNFIGEDDH
jgi:hypothetical protein